MIEMRYLGERMVRGERGKGAKRRLCDIDNNNHIKDDDQVCVSLFRNDAMLIELRLKTITHHGVP